MRIFHWRGYYSFYSFMLDEMAHEMLQYFAILLEFENPFFHSLTTYILTQSYKREVGTIFCKWPFLHTKKLEFKNKTFFLKQNPPNLQGKTLFPIPESMLKIFFSRMWHHICKNCAWFCDFLEDFNFSGLMNIHISK